MKFTVTVKDPDSLHDALKDALDDELEGSKYSSDVVERIKESRYEEENAKCQKWVEYGEYYRIEFDTDAMTATVLPNE